MGTNVLFIHGIGGPRRSDEARREWSEALAEGMVQAGAPAVAAALRDGTIGTRFGSYRDLYDPPEEAQGVALEDLGQDEVDIIAELLDEMINENAERRTDPTVQSILARALEQLWPVPDSQGILGPVRRLINAPRP